MKPWEILAAGVALFLVLEWKPKSSAPATGVSSTVIPPPVTAHPSTPVIALPPPGAPTHVVGTTPIVLPPPAAPAPRPVTPSGKYVNGVLLTMPFYNITSSNQVFRSTDGYGFTSFSSYTAAGGAPDFSNVQKIAPQGTVGSVSFPNPVAAPAAPATPRVVPVPASTSQAQINQQLAAAGKPAYSVVVAVDGAGKTVVTPATNSVILPWDGGLYPSIPGAHKLLLPTGSIWNVNTANTAIQNQTAGQYRVTTAPDGTIIAVPTTATPTPVQTQVGQPVASGPVYSGPQNPLSKFGSQLFTGVWDSNPNPTSARIPDASGTGFVNV